MKTLQPWWPEGKWWLFVEVVELVRKAGLYLGPAAFEGRPGKAHQVGGLTLAVLAQQLADTLAFRVEGFELCVQGIQKGAVHSDGFRRGIVVGDGVLKGEVLGIIQRRAEVDFPACCAVRADQAVGVTGPELRLRTGALAGPLHALPDLPDVRHDLVVDVLRDRFKTDLVRVVGVTDGMEMEQSDVSMVFDNEDFAYWTVTVERPLRLRVFPDRAIPADIFKKSEEFAFVRKAISSVPAGTATDDWTAFAKATKLKAGALKKIRPFITEKDATAQPIEGEPDVELRDTENVPFTYDGGIDAFMKNEVLTYAPDAYVDEKKTAIGYEISFTKYFYKPAELREISDILASLTALEKEADGVMAEIMGGIQ